jgi:hypothetical protein
MLRRRPVMRAMATTAVVAGTATAVSGRVARRQQNRWQRDAEADAYEQQQAQQPATSYETLPSPPAPVTPAPTSVEQLTQLAALRDQGVLTDAEFEVEKAKIIGS